MNEFSGLIKHVGVLNNTGKNVVVVFMSLPGDKNHALVIDTDSLPESYNEALRQIVESIDAQQSENLADVLGRRMAPDGSNLTMLQKFHMAQRLQKVPVNLVTMTPRRGINWPLPQVLEAMQKTKEDMPDGFEDLDQEERAAVLANMRKFNAHATNLEATESDRSGEALNLIRQAELIEEDATNLRLRAYRLDPNLKPKAKPSVSKEVKALVQKAPVQPIFEDLLPLDAIVETKSSAQKSTVKTVDTKKSAPKAKPVTKKDVA